MEAKAGSLKSLVLAGELSEQAKSHPKHKNPKMKFLLKHFSAQRDIQRHHKHKAQPEADCAVV